MQHTERIKKKINVKVAYISIKYRKQRGKPPLVWPRVLCLTLRAEQALCINFSPILVHDKYIQCGTPSQVRFIMYFFSHLGADRFDGETWEELCSLTPAYLPTPYQLTAASLEA